MHAVHQYYYKQFVQYTWYTRACTDLRTKLESLLDLPISMHAPRTGRLENEEFEECTWCTAKTSAAFKIDVSFGLYPVISIGLQKATSCTGRSTVRRSTCRSTSMHHANITQTPCRRDVVHHGTRYSTNITCACSTASETPDPRSRG